MQLGTVWIGSEWSTSPASFSQSEAIPSLPRRASGEAPFNQEGGSIAGDQGCRQFESTTTHSNPIKRPIAWVKGRRPTLFNEASVSLL